MPAAEVGHGKTQQRVLPSLVVCNVQCEDWRMGLPGSEIKMWNNNKRGLGRALN